MKIGCCLISLSLKSIYTFQRLSSQHGSAPATITYADYTLLSARPLLRALQHLSKHLRWEVMWEPPKKRQESGRGLVAWQPSSEATRDWLRGNRAVKQYWTDYLATQQRKNNKGKHFYLVSLEST
jgi:hypothetical protein